METEIVQQPIEAEQEGSIPGAHDSLVERLIKSTDERSKDFEYIQRVALPFARSGMFPGATTIEAAITKMMIGEALGIAPIVAMQQAWVIEGKIALGATLMLSLARSRGWRHHVKVRTGQACVIAWTDPNGSTVGESSFTLEEAKRIPIPPKDGKARSMADKDNWRNYPSDMLFARAVSRGIRTFAPEVTNGIPVYSTEEAADFEPTITAERAIRQPERKVKTEEAT